MIKNAAIAPTTKTEIIIPAIAPAPIPNLFPSLPLSPLPPMRLGTLTGGVPGGGGGAGPELNELPFSL